MAITGIGVIAVSAFYSTFNTCGPFKSSAGNLYVFGVKPSALSTIATSRSTNYGSTWAASTDVMTGTYEFKAIRGFPVGDIIHIVAEFCQSSTGNTETKYAQFNMANNTVIAEESVLVPAANTIPILDASNPGIVVRSTTEVVCIYQAGSATVMGADYKRVSYKIRSGAAVWGTAVALDAGGTADYVSSDLALTVSDDSLFYMYSYSSGVSTTRSLSAAGVLGAANVAAFAIVFSTAMQTTIGGTSSPIHGVSPGNNRISILQGNSSTSPNTWFERAVMATSGVFPILFREVTDDLKIWLVTKDNNGSATVWKLFASIDGGLTWSLTGTTGTSTINPYLSGDSWRIYTDGSGNKIAGFTYNENTTGEPYFAAITVVAGTSAATMTASGTLSVTANVVRIALPSNDVSDGTWTNELSSAVNLYASIDEFGASNDADFIQSAGLAVGNSDTVELALAPLADPTSSVDHLISYRYRKQGGITINLTVSLVQGTTVIATWTHTNVDVLYVDAVQTLTGVQADAITNYADLRLRFVAST